MRSGACAAQAGKTFQPGKTADRTGMASRLAVPSNNVRCRLAADAWRMASVAIAVKARITAPLDGGIQQ